MRTVVTLVGMVCIASAAFVAFGVAAGLAVAGVELVVVGEFAQAPRRGSDG